MTYQLLPLTSHELEKQLQVLGASSKIKKIPDSASGCQCYGKEDRVQFDSKSCGTICQRGHHRRPQTFQRTRVCFFFVELCRLKERAPKGEHMLSDYITLIHTLPIKVSRNKNIVNAISTAWSTGNSKHFNRIFYKYPLRLNCEKVRSKLEVANSTWSWVVTSTCTL
jgi:hypothetical protein